MRNEALEAAKAIVAERIEEAANTLRRMPDRERSLLLSSERGQQWPLMLHDAAEHAAWEAVKLRRPPPSAQQIDRMNEVIDWLVALAKQDRDFVRAVWLCCAKRKKSGEAAKIMGVNRDTVLIWRTNGLTRIAEQFVLRRAA